MEDQQRCCQPCDCQGSGLQRLRRVGQGRAATFHDGDCGGGEGKFIASKQCATDTTGTTLPAASKFQLNRCSVVWLLGYLCCYGLHSSDVPGRAIERSSSATERAGRTVASRYRLASPTSYSKPDTIHAHINSVQMPFSQAVLVGWCSNIPVAMRGAGV